jgi:hypothetical protein
VADKELTKIEFACGHVHTLITPTTLQYNKQAREEWEKQMLEMGKRECMFCQLGLRVDQNGNDSG